jgi:hypothetical protein
MPVDFILAWTLEAIRMLDTGAFCQKDEELNAKKEAPPGGAPECSLLPAYLFPSGRSLRHRAGSGLGVRGRSLCLVRH